ncbi:RNA polymerase sigma factor SigJ [Aquihabitans sp. G128]|uniref:RNA polymerase sigma factor SigJ n=1 Tax=Aquihabitans sp. G128 TaxID=2849779 RepID=UPI001C2276C7|nr:RNA polymerase sigma factor SigJ [Aquihabitans sp. G128]QXC61623.1 RNA polymerase sigma factor SigJ [Aquihabitans sp. G128]
MDAAELDRIAQQERPRLIGLAYRMTGSRSDAEDIVQDALLRAHRAQVSDIESPAAYLTTITTRLAIDHQRSARVRRESYVGPWLPEPIAADPAPDAAASAELADTLSMAFLVVLETLTPDERAVLLLHDVFSYPHADIAEMLGRTDASCRQLLRRARQRIDAERPRAAADPAQRDEVLHRFLDACEGGDMDAFLALLTDDAVLTVDGGGEIKTAARHPIRGAGRAARFLAFVMGRLADGGRVEPVALNGGPAALVTAATGEIIGAVFIEPGPDRGAAEIRWVRNPAKLTDLR